MGKRIVTIIKNLSVALLSVIYSGNEDCIICNTYIGENNICSCCKDKIKICKTYTIVNKNNFGLKCYSVSYYSNIMKDLILRLKYKSDFRAGELIGQLMIEFIENENIEFDVVTFVPMTARSYKKRGYNQSEFLGKIISKYFQVPLIKGIEKVLETGDQIGLDGTERWGNLSHCFKNSSSGEIKDKKILLVDDVITTGATAYFCGKILKESQCKSVTLLTAAKSHI